ncbi:MAG: divalent metal cation transporter [Candidatus Thermoplasmatota archaeon]|nr:divalent metal cation transporter [Candidatus Thermoplasmatota archaeon]
MLSIQGVKRYLKFFGPAWLVMIADMDASSTLGAAETGALFRYGLIWFMLILIIPLFFIQEASGRIGTVTEKGLGEVIRENYSKRTTMIMTVPMVVTDMVTYAVEYIGIAIGLELLGISTLLALPLVYMLHILIVTKRKYGTTEIILLATSSVLIVSFVATLLIRGIVAYNPVYIAATPDYLFILAVNVGAVIMPFMLFFQTSATAEKVSKVRKSDISLSGQGLTSEVSRSFTRNALSSMRKETLAGAAVSELLMVVVEMTMSGVGSGTNFASARQLAGALSVVANSYSPYLFGIGLIGAAFLALVVISMGSAWGLVEALGLKRNRANSVYIMESLPALITAMIIPQSLLINAVLYLLVLFVFVLIGPAVMMGLISKNRRVMREYATGKKREIMYWASLAFVVLFGILALA